MTILANYTTFRYIFADRILSAPDAGMTFTAGPPSTIERAGGSFIADGAATGMYCEPKNTANNDGKRGYISALTATLMTWDASGATLTAEGATPGQQLRSFYVGIDALEEWPGPFSQTTDKVRSGGFSGGISVTETAGTGELVATVNNFATDAIPGADEYDWYLSQRTDDPTKQYLEISRYGIESTSGDGYSGTVQINKTALANTELGSWSLSSPMTPDQRRGLYAFCDLYVRRRSDGAIQWLSLDRWSKGVA